MEEENVGLSKSLEVHFTLGSHLDLYWMGDSRACLDRGAEIIGRALELCRAHPDYCFYIETTVFADWFLKRHPEEKAYMEKLLREGRLEIGGVYVDRSEHMHGGESIVRQYVYGVRWMRENFGVSPCSVCHPDLPGLSPQVPQICAKTGIRYYLRARGIGAVFSWEAPDGSRVIYDNVAPGLLWGYGQKSLEDIDRILDEAEGLPPKIVVRGGYTDLQMPNEDIYALIAAAGEKYPHVTFKISSPSRVLGWYAEHPEHQLTAIRGEWPYGWGSNAATAAEAFRLSSKLENLLLTCEKFVAIARAMGLEPEPPMEKSLWWYITGRYRGEIEWADIPPGQELVEAWRTELFTQDHNYFGFHGAQSEFNKVILKQAGIYYASCLSRDSLSKISGLIRPGLESSLSKGRIVVFNPLSWERDSAVQLLSSDVLDADLKKVCVLDARGNEVVSQLNAAEDAITFQCRDVPSVGYQTYYLATCGESRKCGSCVTSKRVGKQQALENRHFIVRVDRARGVFSGIYDKMLERELAGGSPEHLFGEIISYEDSGVDVRYNFTGRKTRDSFENYQFYQKEDGPLYASFVLEGEILGARVVKEFIMYEDLHRLDLNVTIYWWGKKCEHIRCSFPFASAGYGETWYGVPFYAMRWPEMMEGIDPEKILRMHETSPDEILAEDRRHFREVCKWVDVGYDGYGVTLAVGTPSVWIDEEVVEPLLLRTSYSCGDNNLWSLNPGQHEWRFRIQPHCGDWQQGKAYRSGWEHNNELFVLSPRGITQNGFEVEPPSGAGDQTACKADSRGAGRTAARLETAQSFCELDPANLVLTALKSAYDDPGAIIVRYYEAEGRPVEAHIKMFVPIREASEVNLLEEDPRPVVFSGNSARVPTAKHEIKTLKLTLDL